VSLFFGIVLFLGLALGVGIIILVPTAPVIIAVALLFVIFVILLSIIASTLGAIFKLALYEYAQTGVVPGGFSPALIQNAVKR
jgi:hypothetical protein